MHILVVTFGLKDLSDSDYRAGCESEASAFAGIPGLISKVWLANEATNTYGGVYTFGDRGSMQEYVRGELFASMTTDPNIVDFKSSDFEVLDGPTRITRGLPERAAV